MQAMKSHRLAVKARTWAGACALAFAGLGQAAPVTLTFDELVKGPQDPNGIRDILYQGFRFSVNCHHHFGVDGYTSADNPFLGFDRGSCRSPGYYNPDYDGPYLPSDPRGELAYLLVERIDGQTFSLLGLQPISAGLDLRVHSPTGASRALNEVAPSGSGWAYLSFEGDAWSHQPWIVFTTSYSANPLGFDDLRLDVPEPSTLPLIGLALALAGVQTRRAGQRRAPTA